MNLIPDILTSAPGDSPPPSPRNTQRNALDIRPAVVRTYAAVSEVRRDVADIRAVVSGLQRNMQENQGGNRSQDQLVSVILAPSLAQQAFTVV